MSDSKLDSRFAIILLFLCVRSWNSTLRSGSYKQNEITPSSMCSRSVQFSSLWPNKTAFANTRHSSALSAKFYYRYQPLQSLIVYCSTTIINVNPLALPCCKGYAMRHQIILLLLSALSCAKHAIIRKCLRPMAINDNSYFSKWSRAPNQRRRALIWIPGNTRCSFWNPINLQIATINPSTEQRDKHRLAYVASWNARFCRLPEYILDSFHARRVCTFSIPCRDFIVRPETIPW